MQCRPSTPNNTRYRTQAVQTLVTTKLVLASVVTHQWAPHGVHLNLHQVLLRSGPGAWLRPHHPLLAWRPLLERTNRPSPTPPTVDFWLSSQTSQGAAMPNHKPDALEEHAAALAARLQGLQTEVAALQTPPRVVAAAAAAPSTPAEVQGGMAAAAAGQVVAYSPSRGVLLPVDFCFCFCFRLFLHHHFDHIFSWIGCVRMTACGGGRALCMQTRRPIRRWSARCLLPALALHAQLQWAHKKAHCAHQKHHSDRYVLRAGCTAVEVPFVYIRRVWVNHTPVCVRCMYGG